MFIPMIYGWNAAFDIQYHENYLVIGALHVAILVTLSFGLLGLLHRNIERSKTIYFTSLSHAAGSSASAIGIVIMIVIQSLFRPTMS